MQARLQCKRQDLALNLPEERYTEVRETLPCERSLGSIRITPMPNSLSTHLGQTLPVASVGFWRFIALLRKRKRLPQASATLLDEKGGLEQAEQDQTLSRKSFQQC